MTTTHNAHLPNPVRITPPPEPPDPATVRMVARDLAPDGVTEDVVEMVVTAWVAREPRSRAWQAGHDEGYDNGWQDGRTDGEGYSDRRWKASRRGLATSLSALLPADTPPELWETIKATVLEWEPS